MKKQLFFVLVCLVLLGTPSFAAKLSIEALKIGPVPLNPNTNNLHFEYVLSDNADITLSVYSIDGQRLFQETTLASTSGISGAGDNSGLIWDGRDLNGNVVPNGVYLVFLQVIGSDDSIIETRKIVVLK